MTGNTNDTPQERIPPDHIGLLLASAVLTIGGWWGLYMLLTGTIPRPGQRWAFFVLFHLAVTGTTIPIVRFLNVRLTPVDRGIPSSGVILRQAIWLGLFAVTCAWLQIPRALSWSIAFFLLIIFVVLEAFLRLRERRPEDNDVA